MIKKLLHTRYRVTDLEKTVSFYRDVLGLEEVRRHTSGRGSQLVFLKAPGSEEEIELCKFDESGPVAGRAGPDSSRFRGRRHRRIREANGGERLSALRRAAPERQRRRDRVYRCAGRLRSRTDPARKRSLGAFTASLPYAVSSMRMMRKFTAVCMSAGHAADGARSASRRARRRKSIITGHGARPRSTDEADDAGADPDRRRSFPDAGAPVQREDQWRVRKPARPPCS